MSRSQFQNECVDILNWILTSLLKQVEDDEGGHDFPRSRSFAANVQAGYGDTLCSRSFGGDIVRAPYHAPLIGNLLFVELL